MILKFLLSILLFSLFSQIAACNNKKIYNPEIKFVELKEITISKRSFYLFIYAPWCQHCKISLPFVKEEMKNRNDWFLLNGEYLSLEEHLYIKEAFLKAVNKEDPLLSNNESRVFYPSIGYFYEGELKYAKSGLPKTQKNISQLINQIDLLFMVHK